MMVRSLHRAPEEVVSALQQEQEAGKLVATDRRSILPVRNDKATQAVDNSCRPRRLSNGPPTSVRMTTTTRILRHQNSADNHMRIRIQTQETTNGQEEEAVETTANRIQGPPTSMATRAEVNAEKENMGTSTITTAAENEFDSKRSKLSSLLLRIN